MNAKLPFTKSQTAVFDEMKLLASVFFEGTSANTLIRPRLFPLVIGPTGCGKSTLAAMIAECSDAVLYRSSFGEWLPMGVREVQPTVTSILRAAAGGRVVLFIDELDKAGSGAGSTWSRSVINEIFAVIDGSYPAGALAAVAGELKTPKADLIRQSKSRVWICAAGTWQDVFESTLTLGFGAQPKRRTDQQVLADVLRQRLIPRELHMRFRDPALVLSYPEADETKTIFENTGLVSLAGKLGVLVDAAAHDWTRGGMRSIENLATSLLLLQAKRVIARNQEMFTRQVRLCGDGQGQQTEPVDAAD